MKILVRVGVFVVALIAFFASILNIVDYALNKPEVIRTLFGPTNRIYEQWVQFPIARVLDAIASGKAPAFETPTPFLSILISAGIAAGSLLVGRFYWYHSDEGTRLQWRVAVVAFFIAILVTRSGILAFASTN